MTRLLVKPERLLLRFLLMTVIVILLILFSQYSISQSLQNLKENEKLIEAASQQQKITLQITQQLTADKLQGVEMTLPLDSLTEKLVYLQKQEINSSEAMKLYPQGYPLLSKTFADFYKAEAASLNEDGIPMYVNLLAKQKNYLEELDKFMIAVGEYSNEKVNRFRRLQALVLWGTIGIISLGAIFIFLPAVKKIKQQNDQLKEIAFNQSHVIRRPLANIKLFLNLMRVSPAEENGVLLEHMQTEADQLDDIICQSVKHTELLL